MTAMNKPSPTTEALVARPCTHDLADMETACADGMCPLCLAAALREKESDLQAVQVLRDLMTERAHAAERELAELRAQQPVAWIWHDHAGPGSLSLRWHEPRDSEYASKWEPLYRAGMVGLQSRRALHLHGAGLE